MKKITLLVAAVLITANIWAVDPTWTRVWENSQTLSNKPTYIGTTNNLRSIAAGTFEGQKVVVVPTREGGNAVKLLYASDGTEWKNLNITGITGGAIVMSDAAVTTDGKILVSNVVSASSSVFKVYRWDNSTDAPTVAISYTLSAAHRLGDHINVKGSISDGTCKVYAMSTQLVSTKATIFRFDMISDGNGGYVFNNTPVIVTDQVAATGGNASVDIMQNQQYVYKFNGGNMTKLNADGTIPNPAEATSSGVVPTGSNSARFIMNRPAVNVGEPDTAYIAAYAYGANQERGLIFKFANGILNSTSAATCTYLPVLGTTSNGNGSGKIVLDEITSSSAVVYVYACNNGIGKYSITWPSTPTSINSITESLKITKTASLLKIEGATPVAIELFNTLGQKVQSVTNRSEMNISNLRGVHIVKVNVNGKVSTQKVSI